MLFFDLDGTLLDSNGVWLDIDVEFLGRQGISPVPADYTDYVNAISGGTVTSKGVEAMLKKCLTYYSAYLD